MEHPFKPDTLSRFLPFEPTSDQQTALQLIGEFLAEDCHEDFFILKGSAGTGKTSMVKAITDCLSSMEIKFMLCAPTAQAARIISIKTSREARTMHSVIYTPKPMRKSSGIRLVPKQNREEDFTLFIVDEASMVSGKLKDNQQFIALKPLLSDFINFVKEGNERNKMLFIGDVYQLPPVKETFSPALSLQWLEGEYALEGQEAALQQVKRQQETSYVLQNAIGLRNSLQQGSPPPPMKFVPFPNRKKALEHYCQQLSVQEYDRVVMIAHTNRDVNRLNSDVRKMIFREPDLLSRGDLVLLHANWHGNGRFLLKGDTGTVVEVDNSIEEKEGLKFTTAEIRFSSPEEGSFYLTTKVLLDTLLTERGDLHHDQEQALFANALKHNATFRKSRIVWDDPYLGAMRFRYAYAITCHRAQGGEWEEVLLHPNVPRNDLRWQYTAVTRARENLYVIGR